MPLEKSPRPHTLHTRQTRLDTKTITNQKRNIRKKEQRARRRRVACKKNERERVRTRDTSVSLPLRRKKQTTSPVSLKLVLQRSTVTNLRLCHYLAPLARFGWSLLAVACRPPLRLESCCCCVVERASRSPIGHRGRTCVDGDALGPGASWVGRDAGRAAWRAARRGA